MANKEWEEFRRQPVLAIWMLLLTTSAKWLKAFWPIILIALFRSTKRTSFSIEQILVAVPIVIFVAALLEYLNFKIKITNNKIVIQKGVFKKQIITIPLKRVQAINIDQNWFHKILGLVSVLIDSPGTENEEIKINLRREEAIEIKDMVVAHHEENPNIVEQAPQETILKLSITDLFKLGISANHLETLAIMLGLSLSFLNNIKDLIEDKFDKLIESSAINLIANNSIFMLYMGIFLLFVSVIVSFFRIALKYANFSISKTAKGFAIETGLINSTEQIIAFNKIQYISWHANFFRSKIPMFILEFHSIGSRDLKKNLKVKIPITSKKLLNYFVNFYDEGSVNSASMRISSKYVFRKTLLAGIIPFIVLVGGTYTFIGLKSLGFILLPIYVLIYARLAFRRYSVQFNDEVLHIKNGTFGESELIIKWHKVQSVSLIQGYYQWNNDLANVKFNTAGGSIVIPYLNLSDAQYIVNFALYKIESNNNEWV